MPVKLIVLKNPTKISEMLYVNTFLSCEELPSHSRFYI